MKRSKSAGFFSAVRGAIGRTLLRLRTRRSAERVTKANTRRAYERLYGSDALHRNYLSAERLAFYDEVARNVVELKPRRVIDVGCGSGELIRALCEHAEGALDVTGIDHAANAIRRAKRLVPAARLLTASIETLELPERYDVVVATEVLEHLRAPEGAVKTLARLCAPGGVVVITIPDGDLDSWEGHTNFWNAEQFAAFLQPFGSVSVRRLSDGQTLLAEVIPR